MSGAWQVREGGERREVHGRHEKVGREQKRVRCLLMMLEERM